jgi:hypothetical protein
MLMFAVARGQSAMNTQQRKVSTAAELVAAAADRAVAEIVVAANLTEVPTFSPLARSGAEGPGSET